ncbi:CRISPR-associated helicase/endonuclease Cas3 [Teredinibacter turnerae]|uniref:CRISPR-associated helicase/endonuclease Cas3 n=1 Tax=Teredinibacter turnerae TaxID=2426 RepID=UPI00037B92C7|nr:CRISPR-associated helicase/endonuclease Cas3 [Teredinibacter turnerae]
MDYIAHIRTTGERQLLQTHLSEVGELAASFAEKVGLAEAGRLLGLLHDFGKYSNSFQAYIKSANADLDRDDADFVDPVAMKGKIDHSTAGTQFIWKLLLERYPAVGNVHCVAQILAICIASHHGGLINFLDQSGDNRFNIRLAKADDLTHYTECLENCGDAFREDIQSQVSDEFLRSSIRTLKSMYPANAKQTIAFFNLGFCTRFLFSCLVDADRINSIEFDNPKAKALRLKRKKQFSWDTAIERLEAYLSELGTTKCIDRTRARISLDCLNKAASPTGLFKLSVPTGGGKTLASLRFALQHAKLNNLDRVIYIIPYTSIIEQNAHVAREVLEHAGDEFSWVLEHHSNLEPELQTWESKLLSQNWDAPVVFTTMVQFLEALFGGGTRGARRIHQLARSVLIFDEIQTLPVRCMHLFCNAINFLTQSANTTAVMCTATQPLLDRLSKPELGQLEFSPGAELVEDPTALFASLNRVSVKNRCKQPGWTESEIVELVLDTYKKNTTCLVIVNTKAWAKRLFERCGEFLPADNMYHLSTNLCAAHREDIFKEVRMRLEAKRPTLCISTQLIEAGVDISFASVVRFLAGLDSIAQAAGRCNRNGELEDEPGNDEALGRVYIVNPEDENLGSLVDIQLGQAATRRVLGEGFSNLLSPEAIERYFFYYFSDRKDDMAYQLQEKSLDKSENIVRLLSTNHANMAYKQAPAKNLPQLQQSFADAAKHFKAIDAPTVGVITPYGEGEEIIKELCGLDRYTERDRMRELLARAQKFSISVYECQFKKMCDAGVVHEVQEALGVFYLTTGYDKENLGLDPESEVFSSAIA